MGSFVVSKRQHIFIQAYKFEIFKYKRHCLSLLNQVDDSFSQWKHPSVQHALSQIITMSSSSSSCLQKQRFMLWTIITMDIYNYF
ncbi:uncharacterized protein LOC135628155 isoform X4 [Musa acuminata AAA Group]|uniref:uncharacterized protein LOC135628155 isoform X4 n=1 Tax=Musa acuminata AAA Group TaxID=214697 RepID=UPI0031DDE789